MFPGHVIKQEGQSVKKVILHFMILCYLVVFFIANFNKIITENTVNIKAVGGDLSVSFEKQNGNYNNVILTGPANFVFEGQFEI